MFSLFISLMCKVSVSSIFVLLLLICYLKEVLWLVTVARVVKWVLLCRFFFCLRFVCLVVVFFFFLTRRHGCDLLVSVLGFILLFQSLETFIHSVLSFPPSEFTTGS